MSSCPRCGTNSYDGKFCKACGYLKSKLRMNKKAQGMVGYGGYAILSIAFVIGCYIAFSQLVGPSADAAEDARQATTAMGTPGLDCDNDTISDGQKATCIAVDWMTPGWALGTIGVMIVLIGGGWLIKNRNPPGGSN